MKRVLSIQDISCLGKCSLTVALPIISAMGVETVVLPTAVLSTHTQFRGFTFRDLTSDLLPISEHWKKEHIDFDAIYTGYLGSFEQLKLVTRIFDDFQTPNTKIIIDPVMGDGGKLYTGFTPEFARQMAVLCSRADVILPNLTEASFLLDLPYKETDFDENELKQILTRLCALGAKTAVLTGVSLKPGRVGVMSLNAETGAFFSYDREHLPVTYHGTGDVFASAFSGAVALGKTTEEALIIATDYTVACVSCTLHDENRRTYGVNFEQAIPQLLEQLR